MVGEDEKDHENPKYKYMTHQELEKIMEKHGQWLCSMYPLVSSAGVGVHEGKPCITVYHNWFFNEVKKAKVKAVMGENVPFHFVLADPNVISS